MKCRSEVNDSRLSCDECSLFTEAVLPLKLKQGNQPEAVLMINELYGLLAIVQG